MGERRAYAVLGVGFLLMVRTLLALNVSGGEHDSEDHNVVFLEGVSDLSDFIIPKDSDNFLLVNNRTSDRVNNSNSETNDSDKSESTIAEENDSTEVPITTMNAQVSRTTNSAESSDERPATATTLTAALGVDGEEATSPDDVMTTSENGAVSEGILEDQTTVTDVVEESTAVIDVTEDLPTVADVIDVSDVSVLTDINSGIENPQEVTTVDYIADTISGDLDTDSGGCLSVESECNLSPTESLASNGSSHTISPVDAEDTLFPQPSYLNSSSSSSSSSDFRLEMPQITNKDDANMEAATLQSDVETEKQMLVSPPSVVFVDPIITITEMEELVTENQVPTTENEFDNGSVTTATEVTAEAEIPERAVTDVGASDTKGTDNGDEYDLIVETLISTATVYYDEESLQNLDTSRRVARTVSQDFDAMGFEVSNQYRGFLSPDPASIKTFMTVSSQGVFERRRKSERKSNAEPDIDDIIKGIVQLLGGNVKVTAAQAVDTRLTTFGGRPNHHSSRINNRGPPRLTHIPFGVMNSDILTRPPIRLPVTPPASIPNLRPIPGMPPGRPQFVANTRPPFLAPLPPSLASRPSPPILRPYATGVPLPIDLLPNAGENTEGTPVVPVNPVFPNYEYHDEETSVPDDNVPILEASSSIDVNSQSVEISSTLSEEILIKTITSTTALFTTTEEAPSTSEKAELSTQNFAAGPVVSTTALPIPVTETSTKTDLEPSMLEPTSVLITPTPVTEEEPQQISTVVTMVISSSQSLPSSLESSINSQLSSSATPPLQLPTSALSTQRPPPVFQSSSTSPPTPSLSRPRPGVVLDDSNYRPGQIITGTVVPFDTGRPGDIFDVTVSALQGFGGGSRPVARPPINPNIGPPYVIPVAAQNNNDGPLITTPVGGNNGFVSIDGRKTYFDLFPTATQSQELTQDNTVGTGVGIIVPEEEEGQGSYGGFYEVKPLQQPPPVRRPLPTQAPTPSSTKSSPLPVPPTRKPAYNRRPTQPPIRIDTCIVGDDSTCQEQLSEVCRTEEGVSSCYCKAGTARRRPRTPCKRMISLRVSMKVDRVGDQRIVWGGNYGNPESEEYRQLEWESRHAISNAMSKTRLASAYMGNIIHKFYSLGGKVIVNSTIQLEDTATTRNRNIPQMVQRQMIQVIQNHANNIGDSALYVDGPLNPIPDVSDVNECNDPSLYDCHPDASCINEFGTFTCRCLPGYTDRFSDDPEQVGRNCETCSSDYCTKRGDCRIESGHKVCECIGSYYGTRCEIDGEVLGVAVGASVAAVVIIVLTLIFLCMWSRRWKAQDRKTEVLARGAAAATLGGYAVNVQHKGNTLPPNQYGVSMEDRMRWAQIAESIGNHNIYAQPEHLRGTLGGQTAPPTIATTTQPSLYKNQRQMAASSSGYASLGTLGSTAAGQFSHQAHEQYGLQHLNPVNHLASLQHQQQQLYHKQQQAFGAQSTYGQYGPASFTAMSQSGMGGVSRAPTLGARTPVPFHETMGGAATIGPMGGASVAANGMGHSMGPATMGMMESSEEEMDRPYQLPRPKSRGSLADGSDIYYEPDDLTMNCGPPDRLPPPLPKSSHPQTYNFAFLH